MEKEIGGNWEENKDREVHRGRSTHCKKKVSGFPVPQPGCHWPNSNLFLQCRRGRKKVRKTVRKEKGNRESKHEHMGKIKKEKKRDELKERKRKRQIKKERKYR
jgi:hypothetical protein